MLMSLPEGHRKEQTIIQYALKTDRTEMLVFRWFDMFCEFKAEMKAAGPRRQNRGEGESHRKNKQVHLGLCRHTGQSGEHLCHTLGCHLDSLTSGPALPSPPPQDPSCCLSTGHADPGG